jgi:large subunit ribosomal protein L35
MPKLKTHSGAHHRFRITGNGKILRIKIGKSHLRRKKSRTTRRMYDNMIPIDRSNYKRIKRLLPYGG